MKRSALRLSALFLTAAAACAVAFSPAAQAQKTGPKISYITVDHPDAVTTTEVTGINDFNEIVGIYDDALGNIHSYECTRGTSHFKNIDVPGSVQTYVFRINDLGEIVGTYFDKNGIQHGFVRLPDLLPGWQPIYIPIDVPGAVPNKQYSYELGTGLGTSAFGLNNRGEVVGQYADKNGVGHGYYASLEGFASYTAPDSNNVAGFPGGSGLADINDFGDVAGEFCPSNHMDPIFVHGFLLHNGQRTVIDPPGSVATQVFGLNNSREVSGFYYDAHFVGHGFIYNKANKNPFLTIDVPGAVYITTVGTVNNCDRFVGEYTDGMGLTHGYIGTRE